MAFYIDSKPVEVLHEILEKKYQGVLDQAVALQKPEFQSSFFSATIRAFSEDSFSSIKSIISQRFPELSNPDLGLAVLLTGSDGRLERTAAGSPVELVVVSKGENLSPQALATREKIGSFVANEGARLFYGNLEIKCLGKDDVSVHDGKEVKIIPTRALDARFVAGDESLYVAYKNQLFQELKDNRLKNNRSILGPFKKDFLKAALKVINGELTNLHHSPVKGGSPKKIMKPDQAVLVDSGVLRTDGDRLKGPKFGLMRAVQYSVALLICRNIDQMTAQELKELPPTISERIDWLARKNVINLNLEECSQLKTCYAQGLLWYGMLLSCVAKQDPSEPRFGSINVNPAFLRFTLQTTLDLVKKMLVEAPVAASSSKQSRCVRSLKV